MALRLILPVEKMRARETVSVTVATMSALVITFRNNGRVVGTRLWITSEQSNASNGRPSNTVTK